MIFIIRRYDGRYVVQKSCSKIVLGNFNYLIVNILTSEILTFTSLKSWKFLAHNGEFRMFFGSQYSLHSLQVVIWQMTDLPK
jgi:hypothetical protein